MYKNGYLIIISLVLFLCNSGSYLQAAARYEIGRTTKSMVAGRTKSVSSSQTFVQTVAPRGTKELTEKDIKALEKKLIDHYTPHETLCAMRLDAQDSASDAAAQLACMLSGYKQLFLSIPLSDDLDELAQAIGIKKLFLHTVVPSHHHSPETVIYYTPAGKNNALLFEKYYMEHQSALAPLVNKINTITMRLAQTDNEELEKEKKVLLEEYRANSMNDYLRGYLLGYPEESIELYYKEHKKEEFFLADKKRAKAWIKNLSKKTMKAMPEDEKKIHATVPDELKKRTLLEGVTKINEDLYVGQVADNFYVAMERVDDSNKNGWLKYAQNQEDKTTKQNFLDVGIIAFRQVLHEYCAGKIDPKHNHVWVAYASRLPVTQKVALSNSWSNIEMVMSVTTSPQALLTSHMGISRTIEAAVDLMQRPPRRIKPKDQALNLHSFAAKVMIMQDPKKIYMVTLPILAMFEIIAAKMPDNSVFPGDNSLRELVENRQEAVAKAKKEFYAETNREKKSLAKGQLIFSQAKLEPYREYIPILRHYPSRIIIELAQDYIHPEKFIIQKPNGEFLVFFDSSTIDYQWLFRKPFSEHMFYVLVDLYALAQFGALVH